MKILFATHFFPPGHEGGTESYTLGLAQTLMHAGHTPAVICAENWGAGPDWRPRFRDTVYEGLPVRRLRWNWQLAPDPFVNLYDNREVERQVEAYIHQFAPDVVHITSCYSLGAGVIRAAHRAGVSTILTLTDFWFISPRHSLARTDETLCGGPTSALECATCLGSQSTIYRALSHARPRDLAPLVFAGVSRWPTLSRRRGFRGFVGNVAARHRHLRSVFDQVDTAIAPSSGLRDVYVRNGYPAERIRLSRYGLDTAWVAQVRPRPHDSPIAIGYVGQIEPVKGIDLLIQAFQSLPGRLAARVELKIFGGLNKNPTYGARLRHLAGGDPAIQLMGAFERPQLADVFSQIDLVVVPSVWFENAPLALAEAFAAGKPAIVSDVPGMTEFVKDEVNGLIFTRGDVSGLARALERVVAEPGLRSRLRSGIQPVRTIDEETRALVRLYTLLLRGKGRCA